ncbi:predicted protein [Histoplasma capsulatum G186AR]|uniref:Uncharacterized protein n=2 Tax=Ajellomyces capsulatus TaxID=5037 RepID=C0NF63_AJECG|nr:uncharacterized protein HCBG_01529 [Histoplasma capsulatum G186AR]EEH09884.1 predicted protein [Histoplasma capsulatum G186AR]KAG5298906.1 hypothetical protein I7I52_09038 [Histoplasma capsulatum]QSS73100.1 hypothetical protein I7I50_01139 [Histoplasma capsulatum G186AR]
MPITALSTSNQSPTSSTDADDPTAVLLTYLSSTSSATTVLEDLHASLLSSLQRCGWTEQVRGLALELLRAGHCSRFEEVVDTVVALATSSEDVTASSLAVARERKRKKRKQIMMGARLKRARIGEGGAGAGVDQENGDDEDGKGDGGSEDDADADADADADDDANGGGQIEGNFAGNGIMDELPNIRIPQGIVAEGVKMLHEALEGVFVVDGGGGDESASSNIIATGENELSKDQQPQGEIHRNKSAPISATNGVANANGSSTASSKKMPFSSSSSSVPSLKTTSSSADGKTTTKLKAAAKSKLQENGGGKAAKKTKKG